MTFDAATFEIDPQSLTTPRARLEYMRDFLRRLPAERFDIRNYVTDERGRSATDTSVLHQCGTAACIAGWAAHVFSATPVESAMDDAAEWAPAHYVAAELFGLGLDKAADLFVPLGNGAPPWSEITAAGAATVLDHLLNTGKVDWSVARKAEA